MRDSEREEIIALKISLADARYIENDGFGVLLKSSRNRDGGVMDPSIYPYSF